MKFVPFRRFCLKPALLTTYLLLATTGCRLLQTTTQFPGKAISVITPGTKSGKFVDPIDLQLQLQRFADNFSALTLQALDEYARVAGTGSARTEALQIKVAAISSLVSIASGPNPKANLLDLVAVAELARLTAEDYLIKHPNGPAFQNWVETSRLLETNAWELAEQVLKPAQIAELRRVIPNWFAQNAVLQTPFFVRPGQLAKILVEDQKADNPLVGFTDLLNLDPTTGLDPAVREVTSTRLFAERALFTTQRMPFLLRFQTELLSRQLVSLPEVQSALTNTTQLAGSADRMSRAAESISQTAAQLPDRISAERKEILASIDQQQGPLKDLAAQVNAALVSGEKMSASLNTTLTTFDALMKRFGVGESSAHFASTNSHPFSIVEYGQAAEQTAMVAQELTALVASVNQNLSQFERLSQIATKEARNLTDYTFHRGLVLIASLLIGALATALAYRWLAAKLNPRPSAHESKRAPSK